MKNSSIEKFEEVARAHGWRRVMEDGNSLWKHENHPSYGYTEADELCEDWSYPVEE